jgi:hypothetical protein
MSQEQVEIEFRNEIATITNDATKSTSNAKSTNANSSKMLNEKIESRKAINC